MLTDEERRRVLAAQRRAAPAPPVEPEPPPVEPEQTSLESLTRADLNARAAALGVDNPAGLANKDAVIAAIRAAGG